MKKIRKIAVFLSLLCLVLLMSGCSKKEASQADKEETLYTIGVVSYDPDSSEMQMFKSYLQDYITQGFPVEFYFSDKINSTEDENAFIRTMKKQGAQGIISFYGIDVPNTVQVCEEEEMYYVLGSGTISDEDFEAVKDNPWFLGTVGPDPEEEYRAGKGMADYFMEQGKKSYLVITGGAPHGNFMHLSRARGILDAFQEAAGLNYGAEVDELLAETSTRTIETGNGEVSITLCSGYNSTEEGTKNLEEALGSGSYEAVLSVYYVNPFLEKLEAKEKEQGSDMMIGTVDCFSEANFQAVKDEDAYGNPKIDYVEGKYASMAGPSFALLYNAMSGNVDTNTSDGTAVRLYQGFWTSTGREEYAELYGYTTGIYENAYSCEDLMHIIKAFDENANPEAVKELTEAYGIDAVKARILTR